MKKNIPVTPSQFVNVLVVSLPETDPATGQVTYKTSFMPEALQILLPDTIINYQLIDPTPTGVVFSDVKISPVNDQMSTPSIGRSGKVVTFSDANTKKITFNVSLQFSDADGKLFLVDPEVKNDPSVNPTRDIEFPAVISRASLMPEVKNDPSVTPV